MKAVSIFQSLACVFVVAVLVSPSRANGQSIWNGNSGPLWSTEANWSAGVPNSDTAYALFNDSVGNREVTVDGTFAFQQIVFQGNSKTPYVLTGGAFVFEKIGENNGLKDLTTRNNTIDCPITIRNSGAAASAFLIAKNAVSGTLTIGGTMTTSSNTTFDVRKGGGNVIAGSLVGAADSTVGFNQNFQVMSDSSITIPGPGVSSNDGGGTVAISLGSESNKGTMNLNRAAAIAGGMILLINPASVSDSSLNLGADNAIANDAGVFRTQVSNDGQSVRLNTNGFRLDLGSKTLRMFPYGSPTATFTIDMGSGASELCFANSRAENWRGTLAITNFTKGQDSIRFGTDDTGLKRAQLDRITINGVGGVEIDSGGFLVVPE